MNIIIPLGGKGERFKKEGYINPKPLIKVFEKEIIFYVLDSLKLEKEDMIFIIYYNLDEYNFKEIILNKYPKVNFIKLNKQTKGASETIFIGLNEIQQVSNNKKCVLLDCDTFYTEDILELSRNTSNNAVFFCKNYELKPIFSYIDINDDGNIVKIREKQKISDNANTGIYMFKNIDELYLYSKKVVDNDIRFNNECYTSCIIDLMLNEKHIFKAIELKPQFVYNLGTPKQLEHYILKTYIFLFDLDGTLVLTDDIYFNVWSTILKNFNIDLNDEIFRKYIQGNSDLSVLSRLLPHCYQSKVNEISELKDNLFIENIEKVKIIAGAIEFLKKIKMFGYKIGIVTNCNRKVAESIINITEINKYIDYLVIGGECSQSKPYPDPYLKAIEYFNSVNTKTIIFEDSKTGIQSAKNAFPKCLVGIETIYNSIELLNIGVDISIKNFKEIDLEQVLKNNNNFSSKISEYIMNLDKDFEKVEIDNFKLKGGFISDVIGLQLFKHGQTINAVVKLENKNETFLSKMANELGLYEREYYFYENLSKFVPIKLAKFYGLIKDNDFNNIGILMENLDKKGFKLNLDLNQEKIDVSLKIIESLAQLHAKFWNKNPGLKFKELKKNNDPLFKPKWTDFINSRWEQFKQKWCGILTENNLLSAQKIVDDFQNIQNKLSDKNLTLCHGDVKSPNIFYGINGENYEPYFIDWQYICEGKGVQDLVFFMIESFEIPIINKYKNIFKDYYYIKLIENGVKNYSIDEYNEDFFNAIRYFPFFVAIWFGTVPDDDLIDKNFPCFFIQKLFNFL